MNVLGYEYRDDITTEQAWMEGPPIRDIAVLREQAEMPLPPEGQERLLHDETARKQARLEGGEASIFEGIALSEKTDPWVQDWVIQHTARRNQQRIAKVIDSRVLTAVTRALLGAERAKERAKPTAIRVRDRAQTWWSSR